MIVVDASAMIEVLLASPAALALGHSARVEPV
jgi:hypothetical protein